jgi:hypothetical protein
MAAWHGRPVHPVSLYPVEYNVGKDRRMTRAAPHPASRHVPAARPFNVVFSGSTFTAPPPLVLPRPAPVEAEAASTKRTRIWEFNGNLHCSIIGTCLTTGELRQILGKAGVTTTGASDHDLHGTAVSLAGRHDGAAKLLNKALDLRHRLAINQFSRLGTEQELRAGWREAVGRGEIPGAYWATLTHPAATRAVIRDAFGDVHMLSHMVGAANRADIRRLRELEMQQGELLEKLDRQQDALREAAISRDRQIRELRQALADSLRANHDQPASNESGAAIRALVISLETRLAAEGRRRASLEEQLGRAQATVEREKSARVTAERETAELQAELAAIEAAMPDAPDLPPSVPAAYEGQTLLYVGGRPNQMSHLRSIGQRVGAELLHHDGGREQHTDLLPGLISRADLVLFPVDCISHDAALTVKRLCQHAGKPFVPLRSASSASLLAALVRVPDTRAMAAE